jgi:hypothetical protein
VHKQYLVQRAKPFVLQDGVLYRFGQNNRFCHVLQLEQMPIVLQELHSGIRGGHFPSNIIMRKILEVNY